MLDAGSYYQQRKAAGAKDSQIAREWTTYLANLPPQSPAPPLPDPTPAPAAAAPAAPATPKPSASDAFQRAGLSLPDAAASSDDTRSGWSFTQFRPDTRAALYENYKAGRGSSSSSSSDSGDSSRESHYGSGWRSNLASDRKAGSDDFLRQLAGIDNTMRLRGLS